MINSQLLGVPLPMINLQWLELPMSRINFHSPKDVRAIEVRLYEATQERLQCTIIEFYLPKPPNEVWMT